MDERMYHCLENARMSEDQRVFLSNLSEVIKRQHPTIDHELLYKRASELQEVRYERLDGYTAGLWKYNEQAIVLRPGESQLDEYEFLAHEFYHCLVQKDNGFNGVEGMFGTKINEMLVQYNSFQAYMEVNPEAQETFRSLNTIENTLRIKQYGNGYGYTNHAGYILQDMYGIQLDTALFETEKASSVVLDLPDEYQNALQQINTSLSKGTTRQEYVDAIIQSDKALYNLMFSKMYEENASFSEFLAKEKELNTNTAKLYTKTNMVNVLSEEMACGDILMWGKEQGIDKSLLVKEMNPETRSQKCQEFATCCEILRYQNWPLENIEKFKYSVTETERGDIYTINAGRDRKCSILVGDNGELSALPLQKTPFIMPHIGFSEKDLSISQNPSFEDILYSNKDLAAFNAYAATDEAASEMYSRICGHRTSNDSLGMFDLRQAEMLVDSGLFKNFSDKISMETLMDENYPLIKKMTRMESDYDEAIRLLKKDFYAHEGQNSPGNFTQADIESIGQALNKNLLVDIYASGEDRLVLKMIESSDIDINFSKDGRTLAGEFAGTGGWIHEDNLTCDAILDYKWFLDHGQDIGAIIKYDKHLNPISFTEAVCDSGTYADLKALMAHPDYNINEILPSGKLQGEVIVESIMKKDAFSWTGFSSTKLQRITEFLSSPDLDINAQNINGETLLERTFILAQNGEHPEYLREITKVILDKDVNLDSEFIDGITMGNVLASAGDKAIIDTALEKGVNLDTIFNENLPQEWLERFTEDELKDLNVLDLKDKIEAEKEDVKPSLDDGLDI